MCKFIGDTDGYSGYRIGWSTTGLSPIKSKSTNKTNQGALMETLGFLNEATPVADLSEVL